MDAIMKEAPKAIPLNAQLDGLSLKELSTWCRQRRARELKQKRGFWDFVRKKVKRQ